MSDNMGDRAYARDASLQPAVAWIALVAAPLLVIGLVTLVITGKLRGQN